MVRVMADHTLARPRVSRVAVVAAVLAAMVIPLAAVSADIGGPPAPSSRSMVTFTQAVCDATSCTSVDFDAVEVGTLRSVCVATLVTTLDSGTILEQELGCAEDNVGAWQTSGGFITGVQDTTVTLDSSLGGSRAVTVSAATSLAGAVTPTIEVVDGSDATCTVTWTIRERRAPLTGTVTLDGVAFATGTDSVSVIRQVKEKSHCQ
jgi:hypothetical protein